MPQANINDRSTIEAIYPLDQFKLEAGQNSQGKNSVLKGLRIMSEPDESGLFELTRANRQVGERDPEGDTVFLPPFLVSDASALKRTKNDYGEQVENGDAIAKTEQKDRDYASFIDGVIEAARRVDFKTPDGQDERLTGFHGG